MRSREKRLLFVNGDLCRFEHFAYFAASSLMKVLKLKRVRLGGCVRGDAGAAKAVVMVRATRMRL